MKRWLTVILLALSATGARAEINVLACEAEWGALLKELAANDAKVYTATTPLQDVHHIQARPSLIAATRRADLVVCTGAQLEIGWLPLLIRESGNAAIQPGGPRYFEAARLVRLLDVPSSVDRSQGDIHPDGNPHVQTDPRNIAVIAKALADKLAEVDPTHAAAYRDRYRNFDERWQKAIAGWQAKGAPLKGLRVVEHHNAFRYLDNWLGIEAVGYLEPKPGLEPSTGHMSELLDQQKANPAKAVIRTSYNDPRASEWFAERAKIPAIQLPFGPGGDDASKDLFSWYDDILNLLLPVTK
jgi:zinc/manganese transport system substrate-binding protein